LAEWREVTVLSHITTPAASILSSTVPTAAATVTVMVLLLPLISPLVPVSLSSEPSSSSSESASSRSPVSSSSSIASVSSSLLTSVPSLTARSAPSASVRTRTVPVLMVGRRSAHVGPAQLVHSLQHLISRSHLRNVVVDQEAHMAQRVSGACEREHDKAAVLALALRLGTVLIRNLDTNGARLVDYLLDGGALLADHLAHHIRRHVKRLDGVLEHGARTLRRLLRRSNHLQVAILGGHPGDRRRYNVDDALNVAGSNYVRSLRADRQADQIRRKLKLLDIVAFLCEGGARRLLVALAHLGRTLLQLQPLALVLEVHLGDHVCALDGLLRRGRNLQARSVELGVQAGHAARKLARQRLLALVEGAQVLRHQDLVSLPLYGGALRVPVSIGTQALLPHDVRLLSRDQRAHLVEVYLYIEDAGLLPSGDLVAVDHLGELRLDDVFERKDALRIPRYDWHANLGNVNLLVRAPFLVIRNPDIVSLQLLDGCGVIDVVEENLDFHGSCGDELAGDNTCLTTNNTGIARKPTLKASRRGRLRNSG
ncbi:hypothetical protein PFISCL1PPCAC_22643, partial [Pristionchus fissidentatus]